MFVLNCRCTIPDDDQSTFEDMVECPKHKGLSVIEGYRYVWINTGTGKRVGYGH